LSEQTFDANQMNSSEPDTINVEPDFIVKCLTSVDSSFANATQNQELQAVDQQYDGILFQAKQFTIRASNGFLEQDSNREKIFKRFLDKKFVQILVFFFS
jgi:hypothetical protein